MSTTANKQFVRQYLDTLSGHPKPLVVVRRFVSDPALIEHISQVEAAFPEYELRAHQLVAEDDFVVVRGTFKGVHRGASFYGIEPRGTEASADLTIIYRIENGLIAQHWLQFDGAGLLAQLQAAAAVSA